MKREEYIAWDEYFIGVALLSAKRSKHPNTQVGACIVNEEKRIIGVGYKGFPIGCSDDEYPWEREGDYRGCWHVFSRRFFCRYRHLLRPN